MTSIYKNQSKQSYILNIYIKIKENISDLKQLSLNRTEDKIPTIFIFFKYIHKLKIN